MRRVSRWRASAAEWLNSNKGTKCEIGFYLRSFRPWSFAFFATRRNVSLWFASFGGLIPTVSCSFSSEKSYSPSRLMCCQETAAVLDEPLARFRYFLLFFLRLQKLAWRRA
jgi:hypothetical protein